MGDRPAEQELRGWVERRFVARGPHRVAHGLVNLFDDLTDEDLRTLLGQGWDRQIRYLAGLLQRMDLPRLRHPDRAAAVLFDLLNGAMLRCATHPDASLPTRALDDLL